MVTHDPDMAQYADRVVRLLDGRITENIVNEAPAEVPAPDVNNEETP